MLERKEIKKLQRRIDKLAEIYKNKSVLLYGAGQFLEDIYTELDFSKLNITAISDIKFSPRHKQSFHDIECISPSKIATSGCDIILTTVLRPEVVIPFLNKVIKGCSIKIENLVQPSKPKSTFANFNFNFPHINNKNTDPISNSTLLEHLINIERKLSMPDSIWQFKNVKVYVPYYPVDFIQRYIVNRNQYFEYDILTTLDRYLPDNAVILDIGANIGNHSLYWSLTSYKNVKRIHAFEPIKDTFNILKKNIEINNLQDKVKLYNIGLNDVKTKADFLSYNRENIGASYLTPGDGDMELCRLDDIDLKEEHIDFIKIDVESMEVPLLKGAKETICKYKPKYIFIESEYQINTVTSILGDYGYKRIEEYPQQNWLFELKQ